MGVRRYWRLVAFKPYVAGEPLRVSKIALYGPSGLPAGAPEIACPFAAASGSVRDLQNGDGEVEWSSQAAAQSGFEIRWTFASAVEVSRVGLTRANFSMAVLQSSDDGLFWVSEGSVRGDRSVGGEALCLLDDFLGRVIVLAWAGAQRIVLPNVQLVVKSFEDLYGRKAQPALTAFSYPPPDSGSSGNTGVLPQATFDYLPDAVYVLNASNGTWNSDLATFLFEFLNDQGERVCFVRNNRKNGDFGHFIDYGTTDLAVYQTAGVFTQYSNNLYSNTTGQFSCEPGLFRFTNTRPPVATGNANLSFSIPCDAMSIRRVRVSEVRAQSTWFGQTGSAYVELYSLVAYRETPLDATDDQTIPTRTQMLAYPIDAAAAVGDPGAAPSLVDPVDGGTYRLTGSVKEISLPENAPLSRKVRVYAAERRALIRELWSSGDGSFAVPALKMQQYFVTVEDHERYYRPLVRTKLEPMDV